MVRPQYYGLDFPPEIESVMPMIYKLVQTSYHKNGRIDREDLVQVGMTAAMRAYEDFDEGRGTKFSSFAFPYINNAIMKEWQGIRNAISGGTAYHINNTEGVKDEIEYHNRNTMSLDSSPKVMDDLDGFRLPVKQNPRHRISMTELIGESGMDSPPDGLERKEARLALKTIMDELDNDSREILYRHADGETFAEIGRDKNMPQHTVARRFHKSRQLVQEKCKEAGLDEYA